ncbi:subclass B1 metallo-beta-lactamase [Chryseobacterium sp. SSA4.19]|nr:subclass B1 metallo-beta-lactamase [Chryseobacterium sp. SSA4.19]MCJ8154646.1 subclass B1 metallo-beta-lactamase [Chryseobacterium sp. SSA4.19]
MKAGFIILLSLILFNCRSQKDLSFRPKVVYKSDQLIITQVSPNSFEHTSFLQTNDFGNVPCNGLIVKNGNETIIFDTPTNDQGSEALIKWIMETLHCKVNAIIPTHFHNDCLGGLKAFHDHHIPSYAYFKTIDFARENKYIIPQNSFRDSLTLKVGDKKVTAKFFGEGHTKDNVVGYFPADHIMFGGCLIKEIDAGKGYLGDANVSAWSGTVAKVKEEYPDVQVVIPGHGDYGNKKLLDYTIHLFKTQ